MQAYIMTISKAIEKEKSKLIKRVNTKGLYENFGQKEVRQLEDRYIRHSDHYKVMNENRILIGQFEDWCMNCDLTSFK